MRAKINTGQKENKLIKHNGKYEFGHLPGRYQILQQHIIEMETWSLLGARNCKCSEKPGSQWHLSGTNRPQILRLQFWGSEKP
jgi:hypothetical protein